MYKFFSMKGYSKKSKFSTETYNKIYHIWTKLEKFILGKLSEPLEKSSTYI